MQHDLPLLSALLAYRKEKVLPFHTPGHKGGRGILPELAELFAEPFAVDVSLMQELDDLHKPETFLLAAQNLAAAVYGADRSFFAVNGTSGALHAMLLATLGPGDKLLLPRNAHRAVGGGLVLSGAQPVYMWPKLDGGFGITLQPSPEEIAVAFARQPDIRALLLTSPSYYGIAADLSSIADIAHEHGALLLVDEAHGAHLGFCGRMPVSALQVGADAVAQSTHKIVGALTQCSLLHTKGARLNHVRVAQAMSMLTTTSPNQLLLASLDAACGQLAQKGAVMAEHALAMAEKLRAALREIPGLQVLQLQENMHDIDLTKVTVSVKGLGLSGWQAADWLRREKIAVELADRENILFLLTYADDDELVSQAATAMAKLAASFGGAAQLTALPELPQAEAVLTPRQAFFKKTRRMPLASAQGLIAAEEITFYPPGIPLLLPGERISEAVLRYCRDYNGGGEDGCHSDISVVLENE